MAQGIAQVNSTLPPSPAKRSRRELTAEFRIVTPMYLGGGDPKNEIEINAIRPPSVKGVLRFWWRALAWSRYAQCGNSSAALKCIHRAEAELFGSAASSDGRGGQGAFLLSVESSQLESEHRRILDDGERYLLGQGLAPKEGKPSPRPSLSPGGKFTVQLRIAPWASAEQERELADTLRLFGLLGGLGARTRRGWGSVALQAFEDDPAERAVPHELHQYIAALQDLLETPARLAAEPPYTAFWQGVRMDATIFGTRCQDTLRAAGAKLQRFRVAAKGKTDHRFKSDTRMMYAAARGESVPNGVPQRVVFGMPHSAYLRGLGKTVEVSPAKTGCARRASPLTMHFHELCSGEVVLLQSLFPCQLAPGGQYSVTVRKSGPRHRLTDASVSWNAIKDYLDEFEPRYRVLG